MICRKSGRPPDPDARRWRCCSKATRACSDACLPFPIWTSGVRKSSFELMPPCSRLEIDYVIAPASAIIWAMSLSARSRRTCGLPFGFSSSRSMAMTLLERWQRATPARNARPAKKTMLAQTTGAPHQSTFRPPTPLGSFHRTKPSASLARSRADRRTLVTSFLRSVWSIAIQSGAATRSAISP